MNKLNLQWHQNAINESYKIESERWVEKLQEKCAEFRNKVILEITKNMDAHPGDIVIAKCISWPIEKSNVYVRAQLVGELYESFSEGTFTFTPSKP